jgi:uncharacterized protein YdhG (YjbR/CyaY superfamily)
MKKTRKAAHTVDDYIARFPSEAREILERMRKTIRKAAPKAEETISYQIPAYMLHGRLVYLAAFKKHLSLFPTKSGIEKFKKGLAGYDGAKGTVKFPLDKPIPLELVSRIVKFRVQENLEKAARPAKAAKQKSAKQHVLYHNDGTRWARGTRVNGFMNGYWEWFRKDGTIMRSGHFDKDNQVGEWITYDRNGKTVKVTNFKSKGR